MYFPYVIGKKHELRAIKEISRLAIENGNFIPIIEPNEDTLEFRRWLKDYKEQPYPFVLVTNPRFGTWGSAPNGLYEKVKQSDLESCEEFFPGFIVNSSTTISSIKAFFQTYSSRRVCLIHRSPMSNPEELLEACSTVNVLYHAFIHSRTEETYRQVFSIYNRILVRDGFENADRNADYPEESNFSMLPFTYRDSGYLGFGDFLIVGDRLPSGGGRARCVALHLTYKIGKNIRTRHFLSDSNQTTADQGGKYGEAHGKLIAFLDENPEIDTIGTRRYRDAVTNPGLGFAKEFSMMHHLELMWTLVDA